MFFVVVYRMYNQKKHWIVMGVSIIILITFLGIGFGLSGSSPSTGLDEVAIPKPRLNQTASTSTEKPVIVDSALGNYTHAAVAADGGAICAKIGRYFRRHSVLPTLPVFK